jgi:aryl-alcohol dehydrogenase-like predicted oxidoreductase
MALAGRATAQGTARYAARFVAAGAAHQEHFRNALGLSLSSIGYGTALGEPTDAVDARYREAVAGAVRAGCNVLDTAASYRMDRSEIALGRAATDLVAAGECSRDELVIASKGGFIVQHQKASAADPVQYVYEHFIKPGIFDPDDLAGGIHCMAPGFLSQQIAWSLRDSDLRVLDIYYIQNPETQLAFVDRATFRRRLQLAFARLEEEVAAGRIGCYGVATWKAFRQPPMAGGYMSLEIMLRLAAEVIGPNHHLRAVQLPVNVAMIEAATLRNQPVKNSILPALSAARDLDLTVFASAALAQGQITERAAELLAETFPELGAATHCALQFSRSLPGVVSTFFGSTQITHVLDNLRLAAQPPAPKRALRVVHTLAR